MWVDLILLEWFHSIVRSEDFFWNQFQVNKREKKRRERKEKKKKRTNIVIGKEIQILLELFHTYGFLHNLFFLKTEKWRIRNKEERRKEKRRELEKRREKRREKRKRNRCWSWERTQMEGESDPLKELKFKSLKSWVNKINYERRIKE